jgi:hypothetical protein
MRNGLLTAIALLSLVAVSTAMLAQSKQAVKTQKTVADFSGTWGFPASPGITPDAATITVAKELAAGKTPRFAFSAEEPPMQPWAAAAYKKNRAGVRPVDRAGEANDYWLYPYCLPIGIPRIFSNAAVLFEIVQTPKIIYFLFEGGYLVRRIYMDGKKHLEGWPGSFMGNSTGHWEGDTLVVETDGLIGLDGHAWIDDYGHPRTDALRVTERIRRTDQNTLQIDFLFDDPKAYTKPWSGKKVYELKPNVDLAENLVCLDHELDEFKQDQARGTPRGMP